jgi:hypothetical protein
MAVIPRARDWAGCDGVHEDEIGRRQNEPSRASILQVRLSDSPQIEVTSVLSVGLRGRLIMNYLWLRTSSRLVFRLSRALLDPFSCSALGEF